MQTSLSDTCPLLSTRPTPLSFTYSLHLLLNSTPSQLNHTSMAEHQQQHHYGGYQQHQQHHPMDTTKWGGRFQQNGGQGQSTSKILAVLTLFPIDGVCLLLAGLTLTATLIGLAIATPVFVIFSSVLFPAAITIGLAVTGFLTSGAFGITALSSLTYILNYFRKNMSGGGGGGYGGGVQDSLVLGCKALHGLE